MIGLRTKQKIKQAAGLRNISEDSRYLEAVKKLSELQSQESELTRLIEERKQGRGQGDDVATRAVKFLETGELEAARDENAELEKMYDRLRVIRRSTQYQQETVAKVRKEIATETVLQIEPEARQITMAVYDAVQALKAAMIAETQFYNRINTAGISQDCRPAHWQNITCLSQAVGDMSWPQSKLNTYLAWVKQTWSIE